MLYHHLVTDTSTCPWAITVSSSLPLGSKSFGSLSGRQCLIGWITTLDGFTTFRFSAKTLRNGTKKQFFFTRVDFAFFYLLLFFYFEKLDFRRLSELFGKVGLHRQDTGHSKMSLRLKFHDIALSNLNDPTDVSKIILCTKYQIPFYL